MWSPEKWARKLFASDQEATNFSAHVGWSLAIPLLGMALFGTVGALPAGVGWIVYSMINEFFLHGQTGPRERTLDLFSRLVPATVLTVIFLVRWL